MQTRVISTACYFNAMPTSEDSRSFCSSEDLHGTSSQPWAKVHTRSLGFWCTLGGLWGAGEVCSRLWGDFNSVEEEGGVPVPGSGSQRWACPPCEGGSLSPSQWPQIYLSGALRGSTLSCPAGISGVPSAAVTPSRRRETADAAPHCAAQRDRVGVSDLPHDRLVDTCWPHGRMWTPLGVSASSGRGGMSEVSRSHPVSPVEVVEGLFEEGGRACVPRTRGMF